MKQWLRLRQRATDDGEIDLEDGPGGFERAGQGQVGHGEFAEFDKPEQAEDADPEQLALGWLFPGHQGGFDSTYNPPSEKTSVTASF